VLFSTRNGLDNGRMRTVTVCVTIVASWGLATCLASRAFAQPSRQPPSPPPPAPYPYPAYPYPYQPPQAPDAAQSSRKIHDAEVVADFAAVGALAATDIVLRQDVDQGGVGTLLVMSGVFGGAAGGYILTQKYEVDAGAAHTTTIGLMAGAANGALLIKPTLDGDYEADDVVGLIFLGSAVGTGAGFAYGQAADLTEGQSTFLGNAVLLGTSTAALTAMLGSKNGQYNNWENATLAIGLDAGLLGGALIAPQLDWSKRRGRFVIAGTVLGALGGGMIAGLTTKKDNDDDYNGNVIAGSMTAGLWGGFVLAILATRGSEPDPKFRRADPASTTVMPMVGENRVGVSAGGTW
jgi:hypothetical protein